ncbi:sorting nexin-11-like isoform X2 [Physella acuta]|uniref:sorting nexin-11-like isoform X2 n=1 Tax=Physella acuta TaxID=109671 RepID=UPI0027DE0854|nr:sorting nexin-11-like isoform X2 [Physella acuta]
MDSSDSSYEYTDVDLLPKIIVKDPVIHSTWEHGKYTSYQICIKTEHPAFHLHLSAVRRRYSELIWLYNVLKANHKYVSLPALPPKKVLAERFDPSFIKTRMKLIENFLNELLVTDTVLSDAAFHLFLQTDLTTEEMDEYFEGRLSESFIENAWKNIGHVHTSSYVVNTNIIPIEPKEIVMNEEDRQYCAKRLSSAENSLTLSDKENGNNQPSTSKQTTSDIAGSQAAQTLPASVVKYSAPSGSKKGFSTSIQGDDDYEDDKNRSGSSDCVEFEGLGLPLKGATNFQSSK